MINYSPLKLKAYVLAPMIEEIHFRLLMLLVLNNNLSSQYTYLLVSAGLFSISHSHRYISIHMDKTLVAWMLFQISFTFVFGFYSGVIMLKTRSITACIMLHCYCNIMGPPSIGQPISKKAKYGYLFGITAFIVLICILWIHQLLNYTYYTYFNYYTIINRKTTY